MINKGYWIRHREDDEERSVLFRKTFNISSTVESAILYICALGLGVCTINGKNVTEDKLWPAKTRYDKITIYQKYDVLRLLKTGENAIGVHVGDGMYHGEKGKEWYDTLKLKAVICIKYKSGQEEIISTDKTWKATFGPCLYGRMTKGEIYDSRLREKGFDLPHFDDRMWENAVIANEPGGIFTIMDMPPERVVKVTKPVNKIGNMYDFGINTSGWAKINLKGEKGQTVRIRYDELLDENGNFAGLINAFNKNHKLKHEDVFICSGEKEEYAPSFCLHGFRYVKVENAPDDFEIVAETVHTDLKKIGYFSCNDEMLNKIHQASVQATITNYHGIPTDCPHREQNGWTADAMLAAEQAVLNFDMHKVYQKWLNDFKYEQRPNGQLPGIIPFAFCGYNWGNGPIYDSALILIPWYLYLENGKTDIINNMWDNMVRCVDYLSRRSNNGIADFGIGDWMSPKGKDSEENMCPVEVTNTAMLHLICITMSKLAKAIDKDDTKWVDMAKKVKKAWRENFLEDKKLEIYQTYYACGIFCSVFEEAEKPEMARKLADLLKKNDYHIDCGFIGVKCIFSSLSDYGYAEEVYKMIVNPTYPGYAYWINRGMTTLCESWDMKDSVNHCAFSEVDNWFYKYLAGINLTENGIVIQPIKLKEINYVKAVHRGVLVELKDDKLYVETDTEVTVVTENKTEKVDAGAYEFAI